MKKVLLLLLITLLTSNQINADNWMTSLKDAKKLALATNKLILVDFWATWCGPCQRMDMESWSKPEVKLLMNNYIPVKIDIDSNRNIASKYNVKGIPYIFILDGNGKVVFSSLSYLDKKKVIKLLKKYSYSTKFLQEELLAYNNKKEGNNALELAKKYYDFSMLVDKEVKSKFLLLANKYFDATEDLFKEEGDKNKDKQLIKLYTEVYHKIILGKYKKGLKRLKKKFKEDKIEEKNKSFYDFLNFISYNKLKDNENAKLWYEKMKRHKDFKSYIVKSRKI